MMSFSRITSAILGGIATLILLFALSIHNRGTIKGLGSYLMFLLYSILALFALPFLLKGIFSMENQVLWFKLTIFLEAGLNIILSLALALVFSQGLFLLATVGNFLPFFLFWYQRTH